VIQPRILAALIAFNEAEKIGSALDRFQPGAMTQVIVVDDGSTDSTAAEARARGVEVLAHPQRRGVGAAIRTIIRHATEQHFDILVILAGNDKDRPEEISRLVEPILRRGYDLVQGSRYLPGGAYGRMPAYRLLATRYLHPWLFSLLSRTRITDSTNGFRAIRLGMLKDERFDLDQSWLDRYELEPYLLYKAIALGYRVTEVPVTKIYPPAELGYTKMTPIVGWWSILRPIVLLALRIKR
jgi:dolichol-phosphate mannosyltransferase